MTNQHHSTPWGLLLTKAFIYVILGAFILVFASSFTAMSGTILGGLLILAGVFQLLFSYRNKGTDESNIWGFCYGISDVVFGISVVVHSFGDVTNIAQTLAFWALMYAVLQSVQAMYSFVAARGGSGIPITSKLVHAITVLVAGGMSYVILTYSTDFGESLRLSGLFPIGLGALLFRLIQLMRSQKANEQQMSNL